MGKSGIVLVDDHKLFRNGLRFLISEIDNVEVVAEASNGIEFMEIIKNYKPDLVLMDINMPEMDGIEASKRALQLYPDLTILVLSMFGEEDYYNTMIEIGVKGFLLKDADNTELQTAITRVLNGQTYFSQELLLNLIRKKDDKSDIQLSSREKEVLTLICKGLSNYEISEKLFISQRTVERHRANLLDKTNSSNSISLVIYAIKNKLVDI
ncbi:MAG: response regulator transcription factor [Bacteroidales bacterium]|nr:response regulator transcription factor [Bacteroidales bacterium]